MKKKVSESLLFYTNFFHFMFLDLKDESLRSRRGSWLHNYTDQHREGRGCSLPLCPGPRLLASPFSQRKK